MSEREAKRRARRQGRTVRGYQALLEEWHVPLRVTKELTTETVDDIMAVEFLLEDVRRKFGRPKRRAA